MNSYFIGLDLGQVLDYTALVIAQRFDMPYSSTLDKHPGIYHIVHLQRFDLQTPYPDIVQEIKALIATSPLKNYYRLVVDATGVGRPVVELLKAEGLMPVAITITAGSAVSREGWSLRVPKRDLATTLQVLLQSGRLKIAESLPETTTLMKELLSFRVKITLDGNDAYGGWREGDHDDLVLATALACWFGERVGGTTDESPRSAPKERPPSNSPPQLRWPGIYY